MSVDPIDDIRGVLRDCRELLSVANFKLDDPIHDAQRWKLIMKISGIELGFDVAYLVQQAEDHESCP